MNLIDKILICLSAMTIGLAINITSLLYDMTNMFRFGMLIMAVSIMIMGICLYIELGRQDNIFEGG